MTRRLPRLAAVIGIVVGAFLLGPTPAASAHPLGNFTVNTAARLVVSPGEIRIEYFLDMAELPTFQELDRIDQDGDGTASEVERAAWAARTARGLASALDILVDRRPVRLSVGGAGAVLRPGQAGLDVLRMEASFRSPIPESGVVTFQDGTYPGRLGWHEVSAVGQQGAAVRGSSVPLASPTNGLRTYPQELLASPLDVRAARFSYGPGAQRLDVPGAPAMGTAGVEGGRLAALVASSDLSLPAVIVALAVAFAFGALHALAPGHGKTITAAYLAGGGGRARHAVGAGVAISAMHTASVVAVGLLVVFAERLFAPELVYPWLGVLAGGVAVGLGLSLAVARIRERQDGWDHSHHSHGPDHEHGPLSGKGLTALAVSGGILPSPTAVLVLVGAVALGRTAFGLGLVVAFGLGLAAALTAVGLLAARAGLALSQRGGGRLASLLPILSAVAIVAMGAVLTVRGVGGF